MTTEIDRTTFDRTMFRLRRRYDAEFLQALDLSPRVEREVVDRFVGEGVYFPPGFTPWVPLHEYLSPEYRRSTAAEMRRRYKPVRDPATLAALDLAMELFGCDEDGDAD